MGSFKSSEESFDRAFSTQITSRLDPFCSWRPCGASERVSEWVSYLFGQRRTFIRGIPRCRVSVWVSDWLFSLLQLAVDEWLFCCCKWAFQCRVKILNVIGFFGLWWSTMLWGGLQACGSVDVVIGLLGSHSVQNIVDCGAQIPWESFDRVFSSQVTWKHCSRRHCGVRE